MLLRFYNPTMGHVLIGGRDIQEFNIKSLRGQFGLVSQEPVLFATTIMENIRYAVHANRDFAFVCIFWYVLKCTNLMLAKLP